MEQLHRQQDSAVQNDWGSMPDWRCTCTRLFRPWNLREATEIKVEMRTLREVDRMLAEAGVDA